MKCSLTASQFGIQQEQEEHYRQRVENIMPDPRVGQYPRPGNRRTRFYCHRADSGKINPDLPARSEQVDEQASRLGAVQGVPGALSNQPPAAGRRAGAGGWS